MQTQDIKEIVNNKIDSMIQDASIVKEIENAIEKSIISGIQSAVSSYDIKQVIQDKMKNEISAELSTVSFKDYANKVVENICNIVRNEASKDLTDQVKLFYGELFADKKESITVEEIVDKYVKMMSEKKSEDYKELPDYCYSELTYNEKHNWYTLTLTTPTENFDHYNLKFKNEDINDYYYQIMFSNISGKYKIFSLRGGQNVEDMTDRFTYRYYDDFDKFITSVYLNNTKIIVDQEDCTEKTSHALGDW